MHKTIRRVSGLYSILTSSQQVLTVSSRTLPAPSHDWHRCQRSRNLLDQKHRLPSASSSSSSSLGLGFPSTLLYFSASFSSLKRPATPNWTKQNAVTFFRLLQSLNHKLLSSSFDRKDERIQKREKLNFS